MTRSILAALTTLFVAAPAAAQQQVTPLQWQQGPATFAIRGDLAEIDLSDSYVFLDSAETARFMELTENPVNGSEVGTVASASDEASWFVVFEWDEIGYVPDDEKDELDADQMLESMVAGTEQQNEWRREQGFGEFHITGWHEPPNYDPYTNNLTWAIAGKGEGEAVTINRMIKLLGRHGVMTATLVADPVTLVAAEREVSMLLESSFRFQPGSTYAEYVAGDDRLAEIGLAALVVGGGAAVLAKTGLLARFWKVIVAGLVAVAAGAKRLFGRRRAEDQPVTRV